MTSILQDVRDRSYQTNILVMKGLNVIGEKQRNMYTHVCVYLK